MASNLPGGSSRQQCVRNDELTEENTGMEPLFSAKKRRYAALDGIRGLAVLMVMFFHFFQRQNFSAFRLGRSLIDISHLGQTGVDLFFVLSGFLITGILLDEKGSFGYFRNFYARRVLRIFPLYYFALTCWFFVLPAVFGLSVTGIRDQLWGWFYASNIHGIVYPSSPLNVPGHFWSLAVEEHFYLVWPALIFMCSTRGIVRACVGCCFLSLISRVVLERMGINPYYFTLCRLEPLVLGALLAILVRGEQGLRRITDFHPRRYLFTLLFILAPLWIFFTGSSGAIVYNLKFMLTAMLYGLLIAAVIDPVRPFAAGIFGNPILRTFGKYSYGIYVWDGIVNQFAARWTSQAIIIRYLHSQTATMVICMILQFSTSFVVAYVSWNLFERQFLRLKRHFEYRPPVETQKVDAGAGLPNLQPDAAGITLAASERI